MPVHGLNVVKEGTRSRIVLVWARDAVRGGGKAGLTHEAQGGAAAYIRTGEASARPVHLRPGTPGQWVAGGIAEVDAGGLPGVYQFGVPDEMLAPGSTRALLMLRFDGALIDPIDVDIVAYDPQDEHALGMGQLSDKDRHQFLRATMPGLTEEDMQPEQPRPRST